MENDKLKWINLKSMKCPQCGKALKMFLDFKCQDQKKCKFSISTKKFEDVVNKLYLPKNSYEVQEENNLSKLNNL